MFCLLTAICLGSPFINVIKVKNIMFKKLMFPLPFSVCPPLPSFYGGINGALHEIVHARSALMGAQRAHASAFGTFIAHLRGRKIG